MSDFTDYFLEEVIANIKAEFSNDPTIQMTEDAYIIHRLYQVAQMIVKKSFDERT
jgi:hypothetical protein